MKKLLSSLLPILVLLLSCKSEEQKKHHIAERLIASYWQDSASNPTHFKIDSLSIISIEAISKAETIKQMFAHAQKKITADKERKAFHKLTLWNCMANVSSITPSNAQRCADWLLRDSLDLVADTRYRDSLQAIKTDPAKKDHFRILVRLSTSNANGHDTGRQWLYTDGAYRVWVSRKEE